MPTSFDSDASVILTLFNREYEVILSCLRSLSRSLSPSDEVVIVNDGSTFDYSGVRGYAARVLPCASKWIDMPDYEAYRIAGGFNNPAKAFNEALQNASRHNLYVMSSDIIVTPNCVKRVKRCDLSEAAWVPLIVDMDTGAQYCGPTRLFPAPWFLACDTEHAKACGGWDEEYLKGLCYEDNDFMGRIMLQTGRFLGDWTVAAYHQSHPQPAYEVSDPHIAAANARNRDYTLSKWAGIPWAGGQDSCFDVVRKPFKTGDMIHECKYYDDKLEKVIASTNSPFVKAVA